MKILTLLFIVYFAAIDVQAQLPWQLVYYNFKLEPYTFGSASNGTVYAISLSPAGKPSLSRSTSEGAPGTWSDVTLPPDMLNIQNINSISGSAHEADVFIITDTSMWWSGDYGNSWQRRLNSPLSTRFHYLPYGNVMLVNPGNELYRSQDHGQTWIKVLNANVYKTIQKGGETFAFTGSTVYKSTDLGASWTNLNAVLPTSNWYDVVLLSNDSFIIAHGQNLYESGDAINWNIKPAIGLQISGMSSTYIIKAPASDSLFMLMLGLNTSALLVSPDGGTTWSNFDTGIPFLNQEYAEVLYMSVNGYLFSGGLQGIYRTSQPFFLSTSELTKNFGVNIYPNPATEQLTIEGAAAGTRISISNLVGQQVYSGTLHSNRQQVDISGLSVGSYILQLITTDGSRNMLKIIKQ